MPSTSQHIHDLISRYFPAEEDKVAACLKCLQAQGFKEFKGMIYPEIKSRSMTAEQWHTITYLVEEWDFGYDANFVPMYNA